MTMASLFLWVCVVVTLCGGFATGTPAKRSLESQCVGTACTLDGTNGEQVFTEEIIVTDLVTDLVTELPQETSDTCVVDPGKERRNILLEDAANTWAATLTPMLDRLTEISNSLKKPVVPQEPTGMDCSILYDKDFTTSGIYKIAHHHSNVAMVAAHKSFYAYCDMGTEEGGWTVIQKRFDGSTDFYRGWEEYEHGFGHLNGEHWLGLDHIYLLTSLAKYELRIELEAFDGSTVYAKYNSFRVSDAVDDFKLHLGSYTGGTAGDSLGYHDNKRFTTKNKDGDDYSTGNCAERWTGAWWYGNCHRCNLNGQYIGHATQDGKGMVWNGWRDGEVLKASQMKIRRKP